MSVYKFKLPDIGEGIAEAEIVAWHVKLGDMIEEDQQLADMMTDKATVEMESPVAGKVIKLAGEVGDQIAIGSVLVEIETAGDASAVESKDEQPLGDGAVVATEAMKVEIPTSATEQTVSKQTPFVSSEVETRTSDVAPRPSTMLGTNGHSGNINLAYIEVKLEATHYRGRLALQTGTSVQSNYSGEPTIGRVSGPSLSRMVQEAVVGMQVARNVWVDAGVFFSHLGMEGWVSRDGPTYTRSLVADYSPYYQSGVKLTWTASPKLTAQLHVVNVHK